MGIAEELAAWPAERVRELAACVTPNDVHKAVHRETLTPHDLAALLSPHARPCLEAMPQRAQRTTRRYFGRTVGLYAPIYLSNVCVADCLYCGFAAKSGNKKRRRTLKPDAIRAECEALAKQGFRNVLLVSGEAPRLLTAERLAEAVAIAREYFESVSIEVHSLDEGDYDRLCRAGLEGVTLYMETYDRDTYARVHPTGQKRQYDYRLEALARAGDAGVRRLSMGVLLGLFDWRVDGFWLALHARHLQRRCWQSAVSLSFPRLRHVPERFAIPETVGDADFVQLMLALRLYLPEVGFTLSTREAPEFRDRLVPLGVTMMSAGSSTRPGGYATTGDETLAQFEIEDLRPAAEIAQVIRTAGYDPVWKDFDAAFDEV